MFDRTKYNLTAWFIFISRFDAIVISDSFFSFFFILEALDESVYSFSMFVFFYVHLVFLTIIIIKRKNREFQNFRVLSPASPLPPFARAEGALLSQGRRAPSLEWQRRIPMSGGCVNFVVLSTLERRLLCRPCWERQRRAHCLCIQARCRAMAEARTGENTSCPNMHFVRPPAFSVRGSIPLRVHAIGDHVKLLVDWYKVTWILWPRESIVDLESPPRIRPMDVIAPGPSRLARGGGAGLEEGEGGGLGIYRCRRVK